MQHSIIGKFWRKISSPLVGTVQNQFLNLKGSLVDLVQLELISGAVGVNQWCSGWDPFHEGCRCTLLDAGSALLEVGALG